MANGGAGSGKIAVWVSGLSSIITIALAIVTTYTKAKIDATDERLKQQSQQIDAQLRERSTTIEESKERTSRYTFVHSLFPDLMAQDEHRKELTINLVRLALTDDEATRFFSGFSSSSDKQLQSVGTAAITVISKEKGKLQTASDKESEGFQALINGDYDGAVAAFDASEKAYPSYHQVYELSRLIKSRRGDLNDPSRRKSVIQEIIANYSYGAPPDLLQQLRAIASP